MNPQNSLSSPTLWLSSGMGLVIGLVCLILEVGSDLGTQIEQGYLANGFAEMEVLSLSSVASLLSLLIFTIGTVFSIDGTPGVGRRVMLLLSAVVVLAMASPVLALWGIFWNPLILLLVVLWSGVVAMLHASGREREEALRAQRIADEQNVVRMNAPNSPHEKRKPSKKKTSKDFR